MPAPPTTPESFSLTLPGQPVRRAVTVPMIVTYLAREGWTPVLGAELTDWYAAPGPLRGAATMVRLYHGAPEATIRAIASVEGRAAGEVLAAIVDGVSPRSALMQKALDALDTAANLLRKTTAEGGPAALAMTSWGELDRDLQEETLAWLAGQVAQFARLRIAVQEGGVAPGQDHETVVAMAQRCERLRRGLDALERLGAYVRDRGRQGRYQ